MLLLESYVYVGGEVFLGAYGAGVAAMLLKVVGGERECAPRCAVSS